jgi:hypothetical protein
MLLYLGEQVTTPQVAEYIKTPDKIKVDSTGGGVEVGATITLTGVIR